MTICARSQSLTGLTGTIEETAEATRSEGGEVFALACDVTDEAQVADMVRRMMERYGRIDVLVNNAGSIVWRRQCWKSTRPAGDRFWMSTTPDLFL